VWGRWWAAGSFAVRNWRACLIVAAVVIVHGVDFAESWWPRGCSVAGSVAVALCPGVNVKLHT
jgi:hypothetical protein